MSIDGSAELSKTHKILRQAIGPEFDYYHQILTQPDSTLLIKLGGAIIEQSMDDVADAVRTLTDVDIYPAIVHGAGPQINANLEAQGITKNIQSGFRVTDEKTLDVVTETLGSVNQTIAQSFAERGIPVQQITNGIFRADFLDRDTYGFVGRVTDVNVSPVTDALSESTIPVISCLGYDTAGNRLNINGDTASAALARKIARKFITLTDSGGVWDKSGNIIPVLNIRSGDIQKLIDNGTITDGMIPKINELADSVEQLSDDASAVITLPGSLIRELFTYAGEGTLIRKGDEIVHQPSVRAVNHAMVRQLIESSFGGGAKLHRNYFTDLPESTHVFTTAQTYNGVAIVRPEPDLDGKPQPAYLDKLVVRPGMQGYGIGKELLEAASTHYSGGLYWRTRSSNAKQIDWYNKIADNRMESDGWIVFTAGVADDHRNDCLQRAVNFPVSVTY